MVEIEGFAAPRFGAVKDAFAANFEEGLELGARFSVVQAGELVVDLWAGHADRTRKQPFDARTLTPIFSTTKAIAAILIARAVQDGRLAYGQRVAELWPEFAQGGKSEVTVEQAISHQAGLCGFTEAMEPSLWFDWDAICDRLAAMTPLWPPGTASGYHPVTFGFLAGEIYRRACGRTIGTALREDLGQPFGLDIWIGLPDSELARVSGVQRPSSLPDFGEINAATRAAFLEPWSSPGGRPHADWQRAELPSVNGHATGESLARLMGALANGGGLDGGEVLTPALIAEVSRERIHGQDLVLPFVMSWGAGVMRNGTEKPWGPARESFGHSGWGGSCAVADPETKLGFGYVMNKQGVKLMGDDRPRRLIEAVYAAL